MKGKIKSFKIRVILRVSIIIFSICAILCNLNNQVILVDDEDVIDEIIEINDWNDNDMEENGETGVTINDELEVSSTQKTNDESNSSAENSNKSNSNTNTNVSSSNKTTISTSEEITSNNNTESNSDNSSNSNSQDFQSINETTDFYISITNGTWETDINDDESLCEAKGIDIANKELEEILDWNEEHEDNQKQPIINYSRCYPVIVNGVTHWYLHFFTTLGEEMDDELKSKYK